MAYNHEKGLCWVSHKNRLIFIGIPKNASTSIRNSLGIEDCNDNYFSILERNSEEKHFTIFTVLREPLDRLVSGYVEVCGRATVDSPKTLERDFYWIRNQKKRFYAFINEIEEEKFDAHIEEQKYYLVDFNDVPININYYLCMDNIESDFRNMCEKLGLEYSLLHENRTISKNILRRFFEDIVKNYSNNHEILDAVYKSVLKAFVKLKDYRRERSIPRKSKIVELIQNDETLRRRIYEIYRDDFKLYGEHRNTQLLPRF